MKVIFRADASLQIGTGHVMRCLTLADALAIKGVDCQFICREHEGNLIEFIRRKGYVTHALPLTCQARSNLSFLSFEVATNGTAHSHWLGATQAEDALACAPFLVTQHPNWLVVDHYALDARWEDALAPHYHKLMVIDDLADRPHSCDLLLDQTFGRDAVDYLPFVTSDCSLLCGSHYALLRPEFAALRPYSLQRRANPVLRELLITIGGTDRDNVTTQILRELCASHLPPDCRITVVLGHTAPWLYEVSAQAQDMPWPTRVLVGISDMAQLMADSDLAIGAAGATSWERCCLGLPTILMVLADNQRKIAEGLCKAGAANLFDKSEIKSQPLITAEYMGAPLLNAMSRAAASITNGLGASQVTKHLIN